MDIGPEKTLSLEWFNGGEMWTAVGPFSFDVAVDGILLAGQTLHANFTRTYNPQPLLAEETSSGTISSGPSGSSNPGANKDGGPDSLTIGLAAGLSIGGALLIGLGVWALFWYRKTKKRQREREGVQAAGQHDEYSGKPELGPSEGSSLVKPQVHSPVTGLAVEHESSGHIRVAPEQQSYPAELANQQRTMEISGTPRAELEGYSQARAARF